MTQSLSIIRDNGDYRYGNLRGHMQGGGGLNTQRKQEGATYSGKGNRKPSDRKYIQRRAYATLDAITRPQSITEFPVYGSVNSYCAKVTQEL